MSKETRKGRYNCPNCGAPIDDEKCPYCGTRFIDFSSMSTDEPFWIKIKHRNQVMTAKVMLNEVNLKNPEPEYIDTFDNHIGYVHIARYETPEIELKFRIIKDGDVLYRREMM